MPARFHLDDYGIVIIAAVVILFVLLPALLRSLDHWHDDHDAALSAPLDPQTAISPDPVGCTILALFALLLSAAACYGLLLWLAT